VTTMISAKEKIIINVCIVNKFLLF